VQNWHTFRQGAARGNSYPNRDYGWGGSSISSQRYGRRYLLWDTLLILPLCLQQLRERYLAFAADTKFHWQLKRKKISVCLNLAQEEATGAKPGFDLLEHSNSTGRNGSWNIRMLKVWC
jgi:hypothetical protein